MNSNGNETGSGKRPLYEVIHARMLENMRTGVYGEGDRLPTEKELADSFDVSRITSKKAMDMLAAEGYIERIPGRGSFVRPSAAGVAAQTSVETGKWNCPVIGLIMEGISASFGMAILNAIEREARQKGVLLLIRFTHGEVETEKNCIDEFLRAGVDGILLMCAYSEVYNPLILKFALDEYPLVMFDRRLNGIPLPFVGIDNYKAAEELMDALFAKGHHNIALVLADDSHLTSTVDERIQGCMASFMHHRIGVDKNRWLSDLKHCDVEEGHDEAVESNKKRAKEFVQTHPEITAYYAISYSLADIMQQVLSGLFPDPSNRPEVVSFDCPEEIAGQPPSIYVRQNQDEIGRMAMDLLIRRIGGEKNISPIYAPYQLVSTR